MKDVTPIPARHPSPTVKAESLAALVFERPDLDAAERFLTDFGFALAARTPDSLFARGAAAAPYVYRVNRGAKARFVGLVFSVGNRGDLERLAKIEGASPITAAEGPGGGEWVRLIDPSGVAVDAIFGQEPAAPLPHRAPLDCNLGLRHPRINAGQRPPAEPPEVLRLGHVLLEVADYRATTDWYTRHFGLIPSDVQVLPDGQPAVTFFRLDRGSTPSDHHTLGIVQGFAAAYGHSAFELVDADAVGMGQRVLRERGYRHAWGIGRHVLGSQIFDYWNDPWGAKHEHYCDGDVFTAEVPTGVSPVSREAMAQWGPAMPLSFTKPSFTLANLAAAMRSLRRSPDVTFKKLVTLARMFA
jgi:catechol 2,3-dioxygenase-like lactoylglutathione lyase family enzyme